jgi:DNA-binding transcriptional LysR family regulator
MKGKFDLNDLYYFGKIVEHGSLRAAAATLNVANSVLSQHLTRLEPSLGVRLLERTTRKLQVTDIGKLVYKHCRTIAEEVTRAQQIASDSAKSARGTLRFVCPALLAEYIIGPLRTEFLREHTDIQAVFDITNKSTDVIRDSYDVAFRVSQETKSSTLVVRKLLEIEVMLCASPEFVRRSGLPAHPAELGDFPMAVYPDEHGHHRWLMRSADGQTYAARLNPRVVSSSAALNLKLAADAMTISAVARFAATPALRSGALVEVLPEWRPANWTLQAAYPSRQGLLPAARTFLQYMSQRLPTFLETLEGVSAVAALHR